MLDFQEFTRAFDYQKRNKLDVLVSAAFIWFGRVFSVAFIFGVVAATILQRNTGVFARLEKYAGLVNAAVIGSVLVFTLLFLYQAIRQIGETQKVDGLRKQIGHVAKVVFLAMFLPAILLTGALLVVVYIMYWRK